MICINNSTERQRFIEFSQQIFQRVSMQDEMLVVLVKGEMNLWGQRRLQLTRLSLTRS